MDVILKLLGVWREKAGHITNVRPTYHNDIPLWLVLLIAALLIGLTFWLYRRTAEYVSPGRRYVLATLRAAFLCLLLALVLHPVLTVTVAGAVRQSLLVLVDTSGSMGVAELRSDAADITRAGIAKGEIPPESGLGAKVATKGDMRISRIEVAKAALKNPQLNLLARLEENYDIVPFTFNRTVDEIAMAQPPMKPESSTGQVASSFTIVIGLLAILGGVALAAFMRPRMVGMIVAGVGVLALGMALIVLVYLERKQASDRAAPSIVADRLAWVTSIAKAEGNSTAIGEAVRDAVYRKRGQGAAGLLVISDGVNNMGVSPLKMVEVAKGEGMPIYTYGVGITQPRDIAVSNVFADSVAFVRDEVPVTVRVQSQGLKGQTAKLVLKLGEMQVDSREIALDEEEQNVHLKFTPPQLGDFDLSASIEPRNDEVIRDNNVLTSHLRVIDGRIKVLQIEQLPRWEFKYLQAMMMRDRRVEYKCLLLEADAAVTEQPNSPYLKQLPTQVKDLAGYDLVILGDVDPKRLSPAFMESLNEFVARFGGSVIMVAGKKYAPAAYRKTKVEDMLPVEFDAPTVELLSGAVADKPIRLELTDAGKAATMLRLADKPEESLKRWAQLPPIYWTARVARPKPAAEVLLVDPDPAKQTRYGKQPVMALQQYGLGSVLYVGTDNTWRWRKNLSEQDFTRLWGQIVERMALPHMLGASKRTQLSTDRQTYATGDRVTVFARLYREKDLEPITDPTVKGSYIPRDPAAAAAMGPQPLVLNALPDQPGMYRGEFIASKPGAYRAWVELDPKSTLDFLVTNQTIELTRTAMDEKSLRQLAAETGGQFFREEDLIKLPDAVQSSAKQRLSNFEVELAFSPLYFLLILGVVTAEWIVRKVSQLK